MRPPDSPPLPPPSGDDFPAACGSMGFPTRFLPPRQPDTFGKTHDTVSSLDRHGTSLASSRRALSTGLVCITRGSASSVPAWTRTHRTSAPTNVLATQDTQAVWRLLFHPRQHFASLPRPHPSRRRISSSSNVARLSSAFGTCTGE
jgi:hypothetical protein